MAHNLCIGYCLYMLDNQLYYNNHMNQLYCYSMWIVGILVHMNMHIIYRGMCMMCSMMSLCIAGNVANIYHIFLICYYSSSWYWLQVIVQVSYNQLCNFEKELDSSHLYSEPMAFNLYIIGMDIRMGCMYYYY